MEAMTLVSYRWSIEMWEPGGGGRGGEEREDGAGGAVRVVCSAGGLFGQSSENCAF